jgi:integrase/recombinase XerD
MLDALPRLGRNDLERARNLVLVELIYATGMRVSELVSLPVSACRGDPALLLIRGKGGKERMVPLSGRRGRRWRLAGGCATTRPPTARWAGWSPGAARAGCFPPPARKAI